MSSRGRSPSGHVPRGRRQSTHAGPRIQFRTGWLIAGAAWSAALAVAAVTIREPDGLLLYLGELRFSGLRWSMVRDFALAVIVQLSLYTLLGALFAAGVVARPPKLVQPRILAALLGMLIAVAAATLVSGFGPGWHWSMPGALHLALPIVGTICGAFIGGALRGKPGLWPVGLAYRVAAVLVVGVLAGYVLARALLLPEPSPLEASEMSSEEKRVLLDKLRKQNPFRVADDQVTYLSLDVHELQGLLGWAVLLLDDDGRAAVREGEDAVIWRASARLPFGVGRHRYLTAGGRLAPGAGPGGVVARRCEISVGLLHLPGWGCRSVLEYAHRALLLALDHPGSGSLPIEQVRLDESGLHARYSRLQLDEASKTRFRQATGPDWRIQAAARAQFERLRRVSGNEVPRADRFTVLVSDAFAYALARSEAGTAIAENQGLILALATVFGHPDIATVSGIERPDDWQDLRAAWWPMSIHGRSDWVRHFLVSAAITQAASIGVSDAAGLLKEELDAAGSSGFSFGDLLADRAGTVFGELAGQDEATAAMLQAFIAEGIAPDDLMPPGRDLPEDISDEELEQRYGGVGGPLYRAVVADIEERIQSLPMVRALR